MRFLGQRAGEEEQCTGTCRRQEAAGWHSTPMFHQTSPHSIASVKAEMLACKSKAKQLPVQPHGALYPTSEVLCLWHPGFLGSCLPVLFGLAFTGALTILLWRLVPSAVQVPFSS